MLTTFQPAKSMFNCAFPSRPHCRSISTSMKVQQCRIMI